MRNQLAGVTVAQGPDERRPADRRPEEEARQQRILLAYRSAGRAPGACIAKGDDKGKWRVVVQGFDYYNTKTGGIESGGAHQIAVWLLDTDYDGRSLYPRQVFFPQAARKRAGRGWRSNLKAEIDEDLIEAYRGTVSLPFEPGKHKRIAVKIVDDRGIESLKVMEVE
jgi:adenine-specific DNA-methyltransferase